MTISPTQIAPTDWIHLEGMAFYGYHGADPAEQQLGQRFIVDLSVAYDLRRAGETDDLDDTVNYAQLYRLTRDIVEGPSCRLLEAVAARIAAAVLGQTPVAGCACDYASRKYLSRAVSSPPRPWRSPAGETRPHPPARFTRLPAPFCWRCAPSGAGAFRGAARPRQVALRSYASWRARQPRARPSRAR